MTTDQAIARLAALQRQADAGWPQGYAAADVLELAGEAITALDAAYAIATPFEQALLFERLRQEGIQ